MKKLLKEKFLKWDSRHNSYLASSVFVLLLVDPTIKSLTGFFSTTERGRVIQLKTWMKTSEKVIYR